MEKATQLDRVSLPSLLKVVQYLTSNFCVLHQVQCSDEEELAALQIFDKIDINKDGVGLSRKFMYHVKDKSIFDMTNILRTPSQLSTEALLILSFVTVVCKSLGVSACQCM